MPLQDDYQVTLATFQGPLDLLLYLIRRAEVDVHDIPIHTITEQYFAFLNQIEHIDIDLAGDFLVMASTLIEIKARTISPDEKSQDSDESPIERGDQTDPRHELVQQLLAYQKYRDAAETLQQRREVFARRYPVYFSGQRESDESDNHRPELVLELDDVHIFDLFQAYDRVIEAIDLNRLGEHTVEYDDTPIELHKEDLLDRLRHAPHHRMTLQDVFESRGRGERVGLFLAVLELARQGRARIHQDALDEPIEIELVDVGDAVEDA